MLKILIAAAALMFAATPVSAEVIARTADSFTLRYQSAMETTPEDILSSMTLVGEWWDGAHSYSGDAKNITIDMTVGGCWCEKLADGTDFRHATVLAIEPDRLAFNAPFGPLNGKATRADFTVAWPGDNKGWMVTWVMVIEGPGLGAYADAVDGVMGAGFGRFTRYLEYGEV